MVHELLQAHSIFDVAEPVDRSLGKRNPDTEQAGSQNAVVGVVVQLTPLPGLRQRSALKTDGVHRAIAFSELFLELRTIDQTPLQTVRKHTVDVFSRPTARSPFESGVIEQDPIIKINSIFERATIKVDDFCNRATQQIRQYDHRRV